MTSVRPPVEKPVVRPVPRSTVTIATVRSSSPRCRRTCANEPRKPASSPVNSTKRSVRRGGWVLASAAICRAASITSATLQPLSSAPWPRSQLSRCAPRITNCSGFMEPRISPTTFAVVGSFRMCGVVTMRTRTVLPRASRREMRSASSRSSIAPGRGSTTALSPTGCRYSRRPGCPEAQITPTAPARRAAGKIRIMMSNSASLSVVRAGGYPDHQCPAAFELVARSLEGGHIAAAHVDHLSGDACRTGAGGEGQCGDAQHARLRSHDLAGFTALVPQGRCRVRLGLHVGEARLAELLRAPADRLVERGRSGRAAADVVGQFLQVAEDRRGRQRASHELPRDIVGGGAGRRPGAITTANRPRTCASGGSSVTRGYGAQRA